MNKLSLAPERCRCNPLLRHPLLCLWKKGIGRPRYAVDTLAKLLTERY